MGTTITTLDSIALLISGVTLALSLSFLLIMLWNDSRKELNQFFAVFLFMMMLWNVGFFISHGLQLVNEQSVFVVLTTSLMDLGFVGAGIAIYALTAVLVKTHTRYFRVLAFGSLILLVFYRAFLFATDPPTTAQDLPSVLTIYNYQDQPLTILFYLIYDVVALYLVWRYHRKIGSRVLTVGIVVFVMSQSLGFLNPELQVFSASVLLSSLATLVISIAIFQREIITPLKERISQVESMHKVSLSITQHLALRTVLDEIAVQATRWLNADGAGIYLTDDDKNNRFIELVAVYNLPEKLLKLQVPFGHGVAGTVADTALTIHLDNYQRDWQGKEDFPLARETVGAVICVPLIYGVETIGVLMVVAGSDSRAFAPEDVRLLELLGAQAAVAIGNSRLFAEQDALTQQVEAARDQLETVLTSTENPVVAVDRQFRLMFANPAARDLVKLEKIDQRRLTELVPATVLPKDHRRVVATLRRNREFTYEISLNDRIFQCHLARFGQPRVEGWVAVLNDVTELMELDRLKSEMVRMTSHDLKNPLQAAMANLDLLTDDLTGNQDPEVHYSLENIGKQLIRMHRIISGILDLERARVGMTNVEYCSSEQIITHALEELRQFADDQQVTLEGHIDTTLPVFQADYDQFQRAIINLVENAIKFTPTGGSVCVDARHKDDAIVFSISDTGVGIPAALQERIFDRFFRGKQPGVEHISGSGLGLSLVKTIVESHAGKIWLESEEGVGTTFYIAIPAQAGYAVPVTSG